MAYCLQYTYPFTSGPLELKMQMITLNTTPMSYFDTIVDNKIHHCFNTSNQVTLSGDAEILLDKVEVDNYLCYELGIRAYKFAYRTDQDDDSVISLTYTF